MSNPLDVVLLMMLSIWVLGPTWFSAPVEARADPPLPDPVLPTETEPSPPIPSQMAAQSPGTPAAVLRVIHHQDINKKILTALLVSSTLLGGISLSMLWHWAFRNNPNSKTLLAHDSAKGLSLGPILGKLSSSRTMGRKGSSVTLIDYQLLVAATSDFRRDCILGENGYGCVYRARFDDNLLAAVKSLGSENPDAEREFQNEVDWLCKLHHPNIVSLLGYCIKGDSRFLVYEMMHNGSLESHLHGRSHGSALTWHRRMKIALDIARGLEFLHERCNPPVIHRGLKSSNILLDSHFNAKLSDFGLAIAGGSRSKDSVRLSGTSGYVAPEYLSDGKLTDKGDVYAFGVVLLELLTGRKPVEILASSQHQSIVTWAMPQLSDRSTLPNIVDPAIRNTMDLKHLFQVAAIAVLCVQPEPSYRPLITDVLHSFIPLVPHELGGSLRVSGSTPTRRS